MLAWQAPKVWQRRGFDQGTLLRSSLRAPKATIGSTPMSSPNSRIWRTDRPPTSVSWLKGTNVSVESESIDRTRKRSPSDKPCARSHPSPHSLRLSGRKHSVSFCFYVSRPAKANTALSSGAPAYLRTPSNRFKSHCFIFLADFEGSAPRIERPLYQPGRDRLVGGIVGRGDRTKERGSVKLDNTLRPVPPSQE